MFREKINDTKKKKHCEREEKKEKVLLKSKKKGFLCKISIFKFKCVSC